jgi:hypothetical protein
VAWHAALPLRDGAHVFPEHIFEGLMWERFGLSVMRRMEPERAHALAIRALKTGFCPAQGPGDLAPAEGGACRA